MCFHKEMIALAVITIASAVYGDKTGAIITMPVEANKPAAIDANQVSFPYTAEITGTDIYARSGPGMNHYRCGKLNVPDRVTVVGAENGWLKIVPPAGSFSWISKEYVKFDSNNPEFGKITGDDVRVWAGSDYVEPMHSTSLQTKLKKGDKVKLLGEEKGDYYKISPPKDAYLWVNSQYTRMVAQGAEAPAKMEANEPNKPEAKAAEANEPNAVKPAPKPVNVEAEMLKKYREIKKGIDDERAKPIADQNWVSIKAALTEITQNPKAGRAATYAKAQIDRIEDYELIQQSTKALKEEDAQLAQKQQEIEKKRQEQLAKIPNIGKYVVIGTIKPSQIYSENTPRYIVTDDSGKIIAYAVPDSPGVDLSRYNNTKVGLVGTMERDMQSGSSLVHVKAIEPVK